MTETELEARKSNFRIWSLSPHSLLLPMKSMKVLSHWKSGSTYKMFRSGTVKVVCKCLSVHMYPTGFIWANLEPIATQLIGLWNDPKIKGAKTSKLFHSLAIPFIPTKPEFLSARPVYGNVENTITSLVCSSPPSPLIEPQYILSQIAICVLILHLRPEIKHKYNIQTHGYTENWG